MNEENLPPEPKSDVVLTEGDSIADLNGTPRPDNPSPVAKLKQEYAESTPPHPTPVTDKEHLEYLLTTVLVGIGELRDKAAAAGDSVLAKRLTSLGADAKKLYEQYMTSVYPKL